MRNNDDVLLSDRKKAQAFPEEIADIFLSEFVMNDDLIPSVGFVLTTDQQQQYSSKCKIYRLALVLMVLMNEERENPKALDVREQIEVRTFWLPDDRSRTLLEQVQKSMPDLQTLICTEEKPKELSWARSWFQSIDINETNPAILALFALNWMNQYVAITKALHDFEFEE